jgi:hypothetical protein
LNNTPPPPGGRILLSRQGADQIWSLHSIYWLLEGKTAQSLHLRRGGVYTSMHVHVQGVKNDEEEEEEEE